MLLNPKGAIQKNIHHSTPATFREGQVEMCWFLNTLWQIKGNPHLTCPRKTEQFIRSPSAVVVSRYDISEFHILIMIIEVKRVDNLFLTNFHFLLQQNTLTTNLKK